MLIEPQSTELDRLIFGINKLDFLNTPWLIERMNEAMLELDDDVAMNIKNIYPELPFTSIWLAQAWSLYTRHSPNRMPTLERTEVSFLYFVLVLEAGWPKKTRCTEESMQRVLREGVKRAQQILRIVYIFHETLDGTSD